MEEQPIEWEEEDMKKDESTKCSKVSGDVVMDYTMEFTTHMIYKSKDEMIKWVRDTGKRNGFVITIKLSEIGGNGRKPRITLACERGGAYKRRNASEKIELKRASTGTKKCGCPFTLKGRKLPTDDDWMLDVICGVHNHPAADHFEGHSYAGRLSHDETSLLVDMSKSLVRPKDILSTLKEKDPLNVTTMKTIYNARQKYRVTEKAGRSQMQHLLGKLNEHGYFEWHRSSDDGTDTIMDLFWAHPTSFDLLRTFPHVLILDCTYKTNRYCLPLLEIVGVTSTSMTFSVAFVYLAAERETNYVWALSRLRSVMEDIGCPKPGVLVTDRELALMSAIERVFPGARHLLCRWHISKNVLTKCKKTFEARETCDDFMDLWGAIVSSCSESDFTQNASTLRERYKSFPKLLDYVDDTWLNPYRERFVQAWTNTYMHFGNQTTNRAESAHSKLKRQLGSSQCNFESGWVKTHALLELQFTDIKASFEKSLTVVQHHFRPAQFKDLRGFVSITALEKILRQVTISESVGIDPVACGCVIRFTHGLPCAHEIAIMKLEGRTIPLDSVHSHWRRLQILPAGKIVEPNYQPELDAFITQFHSRDPTTKRQLLKKLKEMLVPDTTPLAEPVVKTRTRGRSHKKIDTSTKRDPSAFELVDSVSPIQTHGSNVSTARQPLKPKSKVRRKEKGTGVTRTLLIPYIRSLPEVFHPFINAVTDVAYDGHCGFRAVAALLGLGESAWPQVRQDLLDELQTYQECYIPIFGGEVGIAGNASILSCFDTHAGPNHWMTMPDMGHLIASRYGVVLIMLSDVISLTFMPIRTPPTPPALRKEITIGFVNGNHFVQVFLTPGHPIPPVAEYWHQFRLPSARGWVHEYTDRIKSGKELLGLGVGRAETVNV